MARGYWMFHTTISDPETYNKYIERDGEAFARYGARFLVRGGEHKAVEGSAGDRHVIIEFDSYEQALACYNSPEYQANIKVRQPHSIAELIVIEGYDGPQP